MKTTSVALLSPSIERISDPPDSTILRLCNVLSSKPNFRCVVIALHDCSYTQQQVLIHRAALLEDGRFVLRRYNAPFQPDYVFFFCRSGRSPYNRACYRMLREVGSRGMLVSYDQDASKWGIKSELEERCRAYELECGEHIPRPETAIVESSACPRTSILRFLRDNGPCVLKHYNSSRARGMQVLTSEDQVFDLKLAEDRYVVQELIDHPLTLEGFKIELRTFLIVHDLQEPGYVIPRTILVKSATQPYKKAQLDSEICNVSYSRRQGIAAPLRLLEDLSYSSTFAAIADWAAIKRSIHETVSSLMRAVAWRARSQEKVRVLLFWGLDLAIQVTKKGPKTLLLEINPFPTLYRGDDIVDRSMDKVFVDELFVKVN
jgi:tubulin-tyrosine ligase family protein